MTKKLVFCIILIFLMTGLSFAQGKMGKFAVFGAISLPAGDFGDDKLVGDGYAKTGFGAGVDYAHPLGTPGLTWFSSAAFIYNGFDDSGFRALAEEEVNNPNVDAGSWMNIAVLSGLKYETELSPTMDFFALGQAGLDYYMPPGADITFEGGSAEIDLDSGITFGFALGAGLVFNNQFNVSLRYLSMGEPEVEGTVTYPGGSNAMQADTGISMILLAVGYNLQ